MAQAAIGVERGEHRAIRHEQAFDIGAEGFGHLADAALPFAGLARLHAGKVIEPDAGMRIDDAERLVLLLHVLEKARQHCMLQHVGVVSRVVGVAVVHARNTKNAPAQISAKPITWFMVMAWPR